MLFSVIIPNYNSEAWIHKGLDSILNQTFKNYEIIVIDDGSKDSSLEMITKRLRKADVPSVVLKNKTKRYNGGTRNAGVKKACGDYILFMDCDDWFSDDTCFEEIAKVIRENKYPDLVRLPYRFEYNNYSRDMMICESTPQTLVDSVFVAPWTKCVKRKLFVEFPENTMIEDVVQHIAQVDNIETIAVVEKPIITWNRNNRDAISCPRKCSEVIQEKNIKCFQKCRRLNGLRM